MLSSGDYPSMGLFWIAPRLLHALNLRWAKGRDKSFKTIKAIGHQDQAFVLRPAFQSQNFLYCFSIRGVTTQSKYRFGWIGEHTASF